MGTTSAIQDTGLTDQERERYTRQLQLAGFGEAAQRRLKRSAAVVSGVGGLGGTAALYLAAAGVGRIVLVRGGALRLDDMNRQVLMTDDWVGKPRVHRAKEALERFNPDVRVEAVEEYVTQENAERLASSADLAVSCTHNFDERYLLNAACVRAGTPMIEVAMDGMEGYLTTFVPGETPCLACVFPQKEGGWDRRGFSVLGAVCGLAGCLAAAEGVKLLGGLEESLRGRLLLFDLGRMEFHQVRLRRDPACPVCSGSTLRRSEMGSSRPEQ